MERILIIGNAGSGKTTFAKKLAEKTGLPLVHLDTLYWNGNWEHITRDAFDDVLQKELEKPAWIMDGNFNRTLPHRLQYCDTIFYFDVPTITCLWGITKRILTNYGKARDDMGGNCIEHFDKQKLTLYRNVIQFKKQHSEKYNHMLHSAKGVDVIRFKSRHQAQLFLESVKNAAH